MIGVFFLNSSKGFDFIFDIRITECLRIESTLCMFDYRRS